MVQSTKVGTGDQLLFDPKLEYLKRIAKNVLMNSQLVDWSVDCLVGQSVGQSNK